MVVAPYNDQVRTIRKLLDSDPRTTGDPVGTVDKFQGGEAAVVFFTMATSTGADMIRSADFLFSRNRLNVAISRARCLAYLVCTEDLLNARARSVDEMRLIATLNAFVEWAGRQVELHADPHDRARPPFDTGGARAFAVRQQRRFAVLSYARRHQFRGSIRKPQSRSGQ